MPCFRCGAREADPARGSRLWVRAVRSDLQVLVCPECQQNGSWSSEVDHCPTCDGTNLVRRLGETVCRSCESSATAEFLAVESTTDRGIAVTADGHPRAEDRDLSSEVATALDRVLGRAPAGDAGTAAAQAAEQTVGRSGSDAQARDPGVSADRPPGPQPDSNGDSDRRGRGKRRRRGRYR